MFNTQHLLAAILTLSFVGVAQAQEKKKASGETSVKIEEVHQEAVDAVKKSSENDEADQVITNKKLRADTGSLSKWSISTSLGYSGGSLEKPAAAVRPNIRNGLGTPALANVAGGVGIKYRTSALTSLKLGVGLKMTTPFQDKTDSKDAGIQEEFKRNDDKVDVDNPNLAFTKLAKLGTVQSVSMLTATAYTGQFFRDRGYQTDLTAQQIFIKEIGTSGVSLGMLLAASMATFDKNDAASKNRQGDYSLGAYPFAEYVINDRFNLRTISGVWNYEHLRADASFWRLSKNPIYQSVGLGISITRDIYLYPNIQFLPENIRSDLTNVALSTSINVF